METPKSEKKKVARKKASGTKDDSFKEGYNDFVHGAELRNIFLLESEAKLNLDNMASIQKEPNVINVDYKENIQVSAEEDSVIAIHGFRANGFIEINKKRMEVCNIECKFACIFSCEKKPDEAVLEEFKERNLVLFTYPFIREYIRDMTTRMDLPPLIIPLKKPKKKG